jgi:hypothetical protein
MGMSASDAIRKRIMVTAESMRRKRILRVGQGSSSKIDMREHLPFGVAHDEAGLDHFGKHKAAGSAASRASAPSGQQHGGKQ